MTGAPWQVLADCPHCRTEAAVLELMDPLDPVWAEGVPSERRCRMCSWSEARGVPNARPVDLTDEDRARVALRRWADEEGEADLELFCVANLGGGSAEVIDRLARREVVPTTFDVIAFLFPSAGGAASRIVERVAVVDGRAADDAGSEAAAAPPVGAGSGPTAPAAGGTDARAAVRLLVSVMVADGTLRAGERTFVVRFLEREGLPPLVAEDLRVWRPAELGPPPEPALRDRVLEAAVHLMHLDRERDGSEWTVVREFARAWGVTDQQLAAWDRRYDQRYTGAMARLGRLLEAFFHQR